MITGDSYIGSNRQHRLSDQVSANTSELQNEPEHTGPRPSSPQPLPLFGKDHRWWSFAPAKPDCPAASVRDFCSGDYTQGQMPAREECVVIGWTDPEGARQFLGALLLAYYDPQLRSA